MERNQVTSTPFFIVGCGRSGTTLLQSLLDAHPDLTIPPESQIYYRFREVFPHYGDLSVTANRRQFIRDLLQDAYIRKWKMDCSPVEVEKAASSFTRAGIIEGLFRLYADRQGARRWGDKSPQHIQCLPMVREDFPDAPLIHLVRDGRDVAEAFQRMMYGPVSALGLGRLWRSEVMHWRAYQQQAGTHNMLEVHYEDLVRTPRAVVERILEFLDEPFVDTTADYADSEVSSRIGDEPWHSSLQREITTEKVGIYRRRFSAREIELIEYVAGDALEAYGYTPDHRDPEGPSLYDHVHASVADRVVRWYRKAFEPQVFVWDLQYRSRKLWRALQGSVT